MDDAERFLVGAPFPGFDAEFQKQTVRVTVTTPPENRREVSSLIGRRVTF
jgi:hypothetical protein